MDSSDFGYASLAAEEAKRKSKLFATLRDGILLGFDVDKPNVDVSEAAISEFLLRVSAANFAEFV